MERMESESHSMRSGGLITGDTVLLTTFLATEVSSRTQMETYFQFLRSVFLLVLAELAAAAADKMGSEPVGEGRCRKSN